MSKQSTLELEHNLFTDALKDKRNFEKLYKFYIDDVYRFSFSLVGNRHDVEDVASETLITFFSKIDSLEWRGISFKYWLFQTAKNYSYRKYTNLVNLN